MVLDSNVSCPPKIFPRIIPNNDRTQAFSYSRLVNNMHKPKTVVVSIKPVSNAPGGPGGPPTNF